MLAKRRGLYKGAKEIIRTPLLLPSFSSKGFPSIKNILATTQEVIDGEILVSAYDLHHGHVAGPFEFAQAVFLDSGGYEASQDSELSEFRNVEHEPASWTMDQYTAVLSGWSCSRPTVFISYDHPDERVSTVEQLDRADKTIPKRDNIFREILFKPESEGDHEANLQSILANVHRLAAFDAVGVTEKEIGTSLQARMVSIARLRRALNKAGLGNTPIHVFGSLDTVSTPLYFVVGADIFDGLSWLRFAYHDGVTIYRQNYAAINFGTQIKTDLVDARCFFANYQYMQELRLQMQGFLRNEAFNSFTHHRELIERAFHAVMEETGN